MIEGETPDGFGFITKGRVNDNGYGAVAVPGSLLGFAEALAEWGTMEWADVVAPAIKHCRRGVVIRPALHARWVQDDARLGYTVKRSHQMYAFAAVHGALRQDGRLSGGADPQRDGMSLVVDS